MTCHNDNQFVSMCLLTLKIDQFCKNIMYNRAFIQMQGEKKGANVTVLSDSVPEGRPGMSDVPPPPPVWNPRTVI